MHPSCSLEDFAGLLERSHVPFLLRPLTKNLKKFPEHFTITFSIVEVTLT